MTRALALLLLVSQPALAVDFNQSDKVAHFSLSMLGAAFFTIAARQNGVSKPGSYAIGALGALAIGTLKELSDPRFDGADMEANALGACVGAAVVIAL